MLLWYKSHRGAMATTQMWLDDEEYGRHKKKNMY